MSIFNYLRHEMSGENCRYNGYLKEYILRFDQSDEEYVFLKGILEERGDIKVIIDYQIPLVEGSISNMIIRYRDVTKLERQALICPYIFYDREDTLSKAVIVTDDYLTALGVYYVATEQGAFMNQYKNYIVAIDRDDAREVMHDLFKEKASITQRSYDAKFVPDFDTLFMKAKEKADALGVNAKEMLREATDKQAMIRYLVTTWFLLKKVVYVRYMVDKEILMKRHDGDNKRQRSMARQCANDIRFVSISDLWGMER